MSGAGFPSKSGGVNLEDYTTNGMILEFGEIAQSLQAEFDQTGSNPVLQAVHISELVASIINFQEKHCGINANRPKPFTRFPYHIFRDYNKHGHLHRLLRFMISYCAAQPWYRSKYQINTDGVTWPLLIDLNDQTLLNHYFAMFEHIEKQLKSQQIIKPKTIYFSHLITAQSQQKLTQIARNHGVKICDQQTNDVTHIILPNNADMEDSSEEHVRTVDKRENLAYIHYWFYPSSYDQWISNDLIDGDAEHIEPPQGAWRVGERFLTDLDKFNEWMVELDYEVLDGTPEPQQPLQPLQPAQALNPITFTTQTQTHNTNGNTHNNNTYTSNTNRSRKRKRTASRGLAADDVMADPDGEWVPPTKKPKTSRYNNDIIDLIEADSDVAVLAQTKTHKKKRKKSTSSAMAHKKPKLKFTLKRRKNPATHSTNPAALKNEIAVKTKNREPLLSGGDMFPYSGPSLTRIRPMIASYPIVIPSYVRWFRLDRIHPIEYQALSSLFMHKAMQYHERYMQIRNFIVNSYRVNPRIYLTVTACRRMIAGDAGMVLRIHKFAEDWGLINYQCDDGSIPEFEPPLLDYTHIDTPFGVKIALKPKDAGNGTSSGYGKRIKQGNKQLSLRENIFSIADSRLDGKEIDRTEKGCLCCFCGIDCSQTRYRCNIQTDMVLCCKCFNTKRYSMMMNDNDFDMELAPIPKRNDDNNERNGMDVDGVEDCKTFTITAWNDDELKKLRAALNLYHDDWGKVSQYVGRNEEECIAQFIQLPIKDAFLDTIEQQRDGDMDNVYSNKGMEHRLSFLNGNGKATPSPFNDAAHPVLAQAASLSAIVNSELVNIASCAALQFVSKQKIIEATQLKINHIVDTKMGRGIIQEIKGEGLGKEYGIKYEWGAAKLAFSDIIDIVGGCGGDGDIGEWQEYPENVRECKAKAAGILGSSAAIAKALKSHKDSHIEQLLQHLVLLQSEKVKAKLAHLEELWSVLQAEREEVEDMKQELFRERVEIAKIKLDLQDDNDNDADEEDIDCEDEIKNN